MELFRKRKQERIPEMSKKIEEEKNERVLEEEILGSKAEKIEEIEKEEKQEWKDKLKKFDESEISFLFLSSKNDIIKESIKEEIPTKREETERSLVEKYDKVYKTDFHGYPVTISEIERHIRTPEYVAKKLNMDADEVRRSWGGKKEIVEFGAGRFFVEITKIDKNLILGIDNQDSPTQKYGTFVEINNKNCKWEWPGIKYDIDLQKLNKEGFLAGEELYDFIDQLVKISRSSKSGIAVKRLRNYLSKNGKRKLCLKDKLHLYPRLEENLSDKEIAKKIFQIYEEGKESWGEAFDINRISSNTEGNLKKLNFTKRQKEILNI